MRDNTERPVTVTHGTNRLVGTDSDKLVAEAMTIIDGHIVRGRILPKTAAMRHQIAKSVCWLFWSRGVVQLGSLLSTVIVARLLSPADYGLMSLAMMFTVILVLIADLGVGAVVLQFRDLERRELNACFWLTMAFAGLGYLAIYASAPAIAVWFGSPMLRDVLRVVGLGLIVGSLRVVPEGLLKKQLAVDRISQAEMAAALATIPVVAGLAWSGLGVWALVAGTLVTQVVHAGVSFWFAGWWPTLRTGSNRFRTILRYSLSTLGARAGWAAYQQIDTFVLGKISGETVLGSYSIAKLLAHLPAEKLSVVASQVAWPIMAGVQTDRRAMRESFLRVFRLVACLTIPASVGMALVAEDLIHVALGEKWIAAVPLLRVLCVVGLIRSLDLLVPPVLLACYRAEFLFWWTLCLLVVMPVPFWLGAIWLGPVGVALTWMLVYPLLMAWMVREALNELAIGWQVLWEQLRPLMEITLVMVALVLLVQWTIPGSHFADRVVRLALASGLGALGYAASLFYRGGPVATELRTVGGWLYRPSRP